MTRFEIMVVESAVSTNGGPFVPEERLTYAIPDEAKELLEPILEPYGQDPMWFFDKINFGRPPAPWAFACLDREYAIAGHVASSRPVDAGIGFTAYTQIPHQVASDFTPAVGVLIVADKMGLDRSATKSPLFAAAWTALRPCSPKRRWLALLDPLDEEWLAQVLPGDRERWLAMRRE